MAYADEIIIDGQRLVLSGGSSLPASFGTSLTASIIAMNAADRGYPIVYADIFKAQTGISFSNYLTKYRLDKSVELIKADSNKPLYQVSEEVGYSDYYYFCKCFRNHIITNGT